MSNQLPDGWRIRKLGSTIDVLISGQSPNRKEFPARAGEYGILKTTAIDWGHFKPHCNQEVLNDFKPNLKHEVVSDDILITKAGPVHRVGVVAHVKSTPSKILVSGKMTLMRVKKEYLSCFIAYALSTEYSQKPLKDGTTGMASSQTNFTHDVLKEIPIFVPTDKNEQQKIAAILTSVDDVIEKTQTQINKLKDLKTGMMQELLTRGVGVDGKPHTEFKDSPVGRIPKGWDVVTLKNITNRITDGTHQSVKTSDDGVHPFLYVSCIKKGQIQWEKASYLSHDEYEKASKGRKPIIGDILYSAVGSYGNAAVVTKKLEFSFQRHIAYIQPNNTIIDSFFLAEYLNSQIGKKQADFYAIGNAQLSVTLGDLGKFQILLPTLVEQRKIVSLINSIDLKICCAEEKNAKNKAIKKALMQDLLTGKVRVNVD
ncbi:restriction endonuclease subunit S [Photobacterium leiognathi]|uniref:restriction endonuclease subunit S n=1 Tax=Photobacterium leiognathi TaxID=553611 RepID=UPI00076A4632|nr:restriction endonuclease subunit S [Photobacterium leiognathi]